MNVDGNLEALRRYEKEVDRTERMIMELEDKLDDLIDEFQSKVDDLISDYSDFDVKTHVKDYIGSSL